MDRRKFLKIAGTAGIGLSVPAGFSSLLDIAEASAESRLVVASGKSPTAITRAAIDAYGGIGKFISRDDIVVIKPNIGFDRLPEQAANTNPEVVATVVSMCIEAGAKTVKVFDRTVNDTRRCYYQSGIMKAAKDSGADVRYIDNRKFKSTKINGKALKSWPVYSEILKADKVINIAVAKHHALAKLTMSMKNMMGIIGGNRSKIHQQLDQSLVDLSLALKPTLTILDAVRILTDNGPSGGSLKDVKKLDTVIVGVDPVAVDSYGATLFGMKGSDLGYVRLGDKSGLGTMDLSRVDIIRIRV